MSRYVPEWRGKTPDSAIPPRVRLRVWTQCEGMCGECFRKIRPGESWIVEHLIALVNGGENREQNLGITCGWCKPNKDARDVSEKAAVARVRAKHLGIRKPSRFQGRPFPKSEPQRTASSPLRRKEPS